MADVTTVIATRDRAERLLATLDRLASLPDAAPVVVVDTGSRDGTPERVRAAHPGVEVVRCSADAGSAARTMGAARATTALVAFCDDDSWWAPGSLERARRRFAGHPRLGLLAARIVVEPGGRPDPTCAAMAASPLPPDPDLPGRPVLGFVACGAIVRREAFLASGGFHRHLGFGGEEQLVAMDLAAAGWGVAYVEDVVAHHEPAARGKRPARDVRTLRNALWVAWLRRPAPSALRITAALAGRGGAGGRRALGRALRGLPWVLRERRVVPPALERRLQLLG